MASSNLIEIHENKISGLKEEIKRVGITASQLRETIRRARAELKIHDGNAMKMSGAIEAFQASTNEIKRVETAAHKLPDNLTFTDGEKV